MTTLKEAISSEKIALNTIPLMAKSKKGSQLSFVIVESEFDCDVYTKFINIDYAHIFISYISDVNLSNSSQNVKQIVTSLNQDHTTIPVFGIIDADYAKFLPSYTPITNIFCTDARDIEMLMLQCPKVHSYLEKRVAGFEQVYKKTISIARRIAYLRIANDVHGLGFSFKKNLNYSQLLDSRTGELIASAYDVFMSAFISSTTKISREDLDRHIPVWNACNDSIVCRGHDVVDLLSNFLKNKIDKCEIILSLAVYYDISSFKKTKLYNDILKWSKVKGKAIFKN